MLALGFSSGLPFLLTGNTLGYWLRDEGTTLKAIGFISWVGLAYSLKFLWAPIVDRVDAAAARPARPAARLDAARPSSWWPPACSAMAVIGPGAGLATLGALAARRGLRLRHPGHRRRRLAHRGGRQLRRARPALRRPSSSATAARCWSRDALILIAGASTAAGRSPTWPWPC